MKFPRNIKFLRGQWDIAPFASVFFLLVLFMLLGSSMVFPPGIKIDLPQANHFSGVQTARVALALDGAGNAYFEHQIIPFAQIGKKVGEAARKLSGPVTLVIQADKTVRTQTLVEVCQQARDAGIDQVLLATRPMTAPSFIAP